MHYKGLFLAFVAVFLSGAIVSGVARLEDAPFFDALFGGPRQELVRAPAVAERPEVPQSRREIALSFAPLVQETAPAVVNVYADRLVSGRSPFAGDPFFERFFGRGFGARPHVESSLGSGVIVDSGGLVVTNNHVIEGADQVQVALSSGREYPATILLRDERVDLAVLKIQSDETFPFIEIADSDGIEIGDLVLAIGNPFGIGQTVTSGIVSALARNLGISDFGFFIQTDAAINPGNSGGALISLDGALIGINTAIFSRSGGSNGIGFAIPSNMVRVFVEAAREGRPLTRPYIGASFARVTSGIAEALGRDSARGALVEMVAPDGPADRAGLQPGDLVVAMDGQTIQHPDELDYRLVTAGIGGDAVLTVLSKDELEEVSISLEEAPEEPPRDLRRLQGNNPFAGASVANLSPKVADELGLERGKRGVVVMDVERGSIAARIGLAPKDILLKLNGSQVASTEMLERLLARRAPAWQYVIERDGRRLARVVG